MDDLLRMVLHWEGRTFGKSNIERLNFPADRRWTECHVTATGKENGTYVALEIKVGGVSKASWAGSLSEHQTHSINLGIDARALVSVTGQISQGTVTESVIIGDITRPAAPPYAANVDVVCEYIGPVSECKVVKWEDETVGVSCIEHLALPADRLWSGADIVVTGHKNKTTGCRLAVLVDGQISTSQWFELTGTEQRSITLPAIDRKTGIQVVGYITNHKGLGGGALIELSGTYSGAIDPSPAFINHALEPENLAYRMWRACNLTDKITMANQWPPGVELCPEYKDAGFVRIPASFSAGIENINACLVGTIREGDSNSVLVAFRGTLGFETGRGRQDWLQNLSQSPVSVTSLPGKVHKGFHDAVQTLMTQPLLLREIEQQLAAAGGGATLYFAGHSKGGALATLAAAICCKLHPKLRPQSVYTFGAPRCGDAAFAAAYAAEKLNHLRYEHFGDFVPHVPLSTSEAPLMKALSNVYELDQLCLNYESVGSLRCLRLAQDGIDDDCCPMSGHQESREIVDDLPGLGNRSLIASELAFHRFFSALLRDQGMMNIHNNYHALKYGMR